MHVCNLSYNLLNIFATFSIILDEFSLLDCYDSPHIGFGASGISFSLLPFTQSLIMACPKKFVDLAVYSCPLTLEKNNSRAFEEKLVVSGHSNWINDIAVTTIGKYSFIIGGLMPRIILNR